MKTEIKTPIEIINIVEPNGELLTTEMAIEAMQLYASQSLPEALEEAFKAAWLCKPWARYIDEWAKFQKDHPEYFKDK